MHNERGLHIQLDDMYIYHRYEDVGLPKVYVHYLEHTDFCQTDQYHIYNYITRICAKKQQSPFIPLLLLGFEIYALYSFALNSNVFAGESGA